jgi:MscS family membrane protein
MEQISQWFAQLGFAPLVGAMIIAAASVIVAATVRLLEDTIALALSRWSGLGIRTQLLDIVRHPLWISVILVGVLLEMQWLMPPPPIDYLVDGSAKTGLAILWIVAFARTLGLIFSRLGGYYPGAGELFRLFQNLGMFLVGVMGGLIVMAIWQINLTPLLASAGVVGIVVGLAAKDTLGNFLGSISVFLDAPFRRGDYIVLNSGERGKVIDIGLRSTRILTKDDVLITIPNSVIVNTKVVNESAPNRSMRVRVKVSVSSSSNVRQVKEALLRVANENDGVLHDPEPRVRFRSLGAGAPEFELLCWISSPGAKGRVIDELNSAILEEFSRVGIYFPTPQTEVYVHGVSGETLGKRSKADHEISEHYRI